MALFVFPAQSVTISGGATEAKQDVMITALDDINTELDGQSTSLSSLDTKLPAQGAAATAASTPVNIASDQTVPVSAVSLPLPSGAATESTLSTVAGDTTSLDSKVPSQGAAATAASLPVNIASDQTVPVSAASLPLPSGAATEATLSTVAGDTTSLDTKVPSQGAAVTAASLPVNIASDQTVPVSAASLPLPSDAATGTKQDEQSAILKPDVVDQIDTTPLLDTSSTNIPASSGNPVEIVASTSADVQKVISVEDIGEFIGLYEGAALSETLVCVLPLGGGEVQVDIASGTRISLRAMENTAISTGLIAINFIG